MKKLSSLAAVSALALVGLSLGSITGCNRKEAAPAEPQKTAAPAPAAARLSAEKTSFQEVTSHLESGGNFYLYLGTEQWLQGLSGKVAAWRGVIDSIPNLKPEQSGTIAKVFDLVTNLIKSSGLEDVSGFGMSSIAREPGLYHSKMVLHHYQGKGSGLIWTLFGQKPHPLAGLNLLSTNTALATFSDLDLPQLWSVIQKQAAGSGFPQAEEFLNKLSQGFQNAAGLSLDKVLGSLGGEFGFALTLEPAKKLSIPLPGAGPLEIPEPGLILVAKVKDDTIFNRVDEALKQLPQQIISVDKPNLKMRTVPVPLPLPIQLRLTVATSDGYLFLATTDALVQEMLAVKAGQSPGLKSSEEFQRLAKDSPAQANHFTFMSKRFGQSLMQVQRQALKISANAPAGMTQLLGSFLNPDQAAYSYSVGANTDEGWVTVSTGNQNPATALLAAGVVAPLGMLSAIAIPNFVKARQTAQKSACINNLRQIDGAKQQWALENRRAASDTPLRAELLTYFKSNQFPACPAGGQYKMNPVSQRPECSVAGHSMND